jgi:hypothetical protein
MNLRKFDRVKTTLYCFLTMWLNLEMRYVHNFLVTVSFVEIGSKIPYFTYRCKLISIRKVRIFFPDMGEIRCKIFADIYFVHENNLKEVYTFYGRG